MDYDYDIANDGNQQAIQQEQIDSIYNRPEFVKYGGQVPVEYEDLTKWMLDIERELEKIEHMLKGEILKKDERGVDVWKKEGTELLNSEGVNVIMSCLRFYLNPNNILTNLDDNEIKRIACNCTRDVINLLKLNFIKFDAHREYLSFIVNAIDATVYCLLKRAYKEGERKFLHSNIKRIESVIHQPDREGVPKKKKLFNLI